LIRHALSLVAPGELKELRVLVNKATLSFSEIEDMLTEGASCSSRDGGAPRDMSAAPALASLRVVTGDAIVHHGVIKQCAATLTELAVYLLGPAAVRVLPQCTRLESLTFHCCRYHALLTQLVCPPAAWLGLSQLHTLRGVSLADVPAATVAAALPRLHTLYLNHAHDRGDFQVAAFYDALLPRLRSFGLTGPWPDPSAGGAEDTAADVPPPLPFLECLQWAGNVNLPRPFMGAQPSTLDALHGDLVDWLQVADGTGADSPPAAASPFARMRALTLRLGGLPPDATLMARVLRAAPQLRQMTLAQNFDGRGGQWVLPDAFAAPAFTELVHPGCAMLPSSKRARPRMSLCPRSGGSSCGSATFRACGDLPCRMRSWRFSRSRISLGDLCIYCAAHAIGAFQQSQNNIRPHRVRRRGRGARARGLTRPALPPTCRLLAFRPRPTRPKRSASWQALLAPASIAAVPPALVVPCVTAPRWRVAVGAEAAEEVLPFFFFFCFAADT
jgi:hypothetical protein